ncbi:hypothetical protein niasHS_013411 [Heterodera schachtii]|uniref:Carboxylesterase type B domain-containing protein n=1 Tax=Heterodera schachtii TaxID=97005 RepID=A0ABD2IG75_HETSC
MGSPITQPKNRLFHRAILLDGSAMSPWAMAHTAQTQFMRLAEELKCFNIHRSSSSSFLDESLQVLRCIQEHSEQNVSTAARHVASASPTFLSAFAPIVDGQIVPNHPRVLFNSQYGTLFREIDLMVGTVLNPAHHLLAKDDLENGISVEKRDKILRTLVRNIFDFHRNEIFQAILNKYTDWENPKDHPKSVRNGLMAALGDLLFTTPLIETLRAHSLADANLGGSEEKKSSANTFFFVFAHEANNDQPSAGLRGSFTGDHLPYILGSPLVEDYWMRNGEENNEQFTVEDKQLSRVMITYVTNFVKSGDPTRPHPMLPLSSLEDRFQGIPWPQFSASTREAYMEISKDRPRMKNYYRNSFIQFWSGFVPVLNQMGGKDVSEDHHLLPSHFDRTTFFGVPRPFGAISNIPFPPPPPPPPPTPFPKELHDKMMAQGAANAAFSTTKRPGTESGESQKYPSKMPDNGIISKTAEFNPNWGWMVLIGITLTVVNLCILIAISRKCIRQHSEGKKKFQYQSYASGGVPPPLPPMDMNYALMAQQQKHDCRHSPHRPHHHTHNQPQQQCFQHHHQHHFEQPLSAHQKAQQLANNATTINNKKEDKNNNNNNGTVGSCGKMRLNNKQLAVDFVEEASSASSSLRTDEKNAGSSAGLYDAAAAVRANNEAAAARRRQSVLWLRMRRGGDSLSSVASCGGGDPPTQISPPKTFGQLSPALPPPMTALTLLNGKPMAADNGRTTDDTTAARRISTGSSGSIVLPPVISENTTTPFSKRSSLQVQQEPLLSASSKSSTPAPTLVQMQPSSANTGLIRLGPTGISPTCPRHGRAAQLLMAKASAVNGSGQSAEAASSGNLQQQMEEIRV